MNAPQLVEKIFEEAFGGGKTVAELRAFTPDIFKKRLVGYFQTTWNQGAKAQLKECHARKDSFGNPIIAYDVPEFNVETLPPEKK